MKYDITIGLEIHAELNTHTKLNCGCKNQYGALPNENVCPVCLALPNAPAPQLNRAAVDKTILAGLAMDCKINDIAVFERKHYFYPDLPAGFQTSQLLKPICIGGGITLKNGKHIRLNRIHLEEDAGKLVHDAVGGETLVDLNRAGTPLNELVTEPDISSASEAVEFLEEVRSRLIFAGVANCRMQEGGMRCDVNISLKPAGAKKLGKRVELKNLSSFKMVGRAIEYEAKRQAEILDAGKTVAEETRKWNEGSMKTTGMRSKGLANDYFYFPVPDALPVTITADDAARVKKSMPPLAHQLREKFIAEYGLPAYDADILTREKSVCDFFQESIKLLNEPKKVSNWLMTNILAKAVSSDIKITPKQFTDVIKLTDARRISRQNSLVLIDELWDKTSLDAEATAKKIKIFGGLDRAEIEKVVDELFAANPAAIADFASTPDKVVNFFMGQTMKRTGGMADSVITKEIIAAKLK